MAAFNRSHQSPTFKGVDIYSDIVKLKATLLSDKTNTLVSHVDNKLIVSSNISGVVSTLVFKSNPVSGVVYYFSRTFAGGKEVGMSPLESYVYQVEQIVSRTGFKPYDQNSDISDGEMYSKWLFSSGFLIVRLTNDGKLVLQSERVYEKDIADFVNTLEVK